MIRKKNEQLEEEQMPTANDIDLSKIANIDAVKTAEPQFEERVVGNRKEKMKKGKFDFRVAEIVPLPSKGLLYQDIDPVWYHHRV